MATNEAIFGMLGREDASIDAFRSAEQKVLMRDLRILGTQQELEKGQTKLAAMVEVQRGKNAQQASFFNAISAMGQGVSGYLKYK